MSLLSKYDIILLIGPNPDKDLLPQEYLAEDHVSLSPEAIFQSQPDLGLRDIALQVIDSLRNNKQVVLCGGFRMKSSRLSLIQTIRKKMPTVTAVCVHMEPKHGIQQVLWAQQFDIALTTLGLPHHEQIISSTKLVLESEEDEHPRLTKTYDVEKIQVPLTAKSHFKLDLPCLMFQGETLTDPATETVLPSVVSLCHQWLQMNPCGRIIAYWDGKDVVRGLRSGQEELNDIHKCVQQLVEHIPGPVYAVRCTKVDRFCVPPQPGVLAFLQLRHLLCLQRKWSLYVFSTRDHMKMAEAAGVTQVKIASIHRSSNQLPRGQPSVTPPLLQDMRLMQPHDPVERKPVIPLYDELCRNSGHARCKFDNGLEELCFVKDLDILHRYQAAFVAHMTSCHQTERNQVDTSKPQSGSSNLNRQRKSEDVNQRTERHTGKLRSWMLKKPRREHSLQTVTSLKKTYSSSRCLRTVYIMSERELTHMAERVLTEAGRDTPKPDLG